MFTKQLNLCAGRTWHLTCVKNTHQTRQLIPAPKASLPKSATRLTTCGCIHAATASDAISPVSSVLATAKELADAGVSAAGLAAFAEKSSRIPFLLRCRIIDIPGDQADALSDCLMSFGALSASTEEFNAPGQPEQQIFLDGSGKKWDRCIVTGLFASEHDIDQTLQAAQDILQLSISQHDIEEVPDQEWLIAMKDSYQPTEVCKGLWIVPDWCEPTEPSALNVRMAPGLAFGTGEHSTTRLCLQWLFSNQDKLQGAHVMDYGTGSGVLAVAALLMGAASAVGTDIDPLAVKAANDNARLNGVGHRLTTVQCSPSVQGPDPVEGMMSQHQPVQFDICMANILRGPLLDLQPRLSSYVKPGGQLLLSGIFESQVEKVQAAYQCNFGVMQHKEENSWALLTGVKQ